MLKTTRTIMGMTALACVLAASGASAQECAKEPVLVGFLPKLDTDPYFQVAKTGAEEAQKELGGSVIQQAPSSATADAQIEFINNLISQQVKVIAIAGNDANAVAPALRRAKQQGVQVIAYDSDVSAASRTLFINQADSAKLGDQMLTAMADLIGHEGEFAILSSTPTASNQNAWIDAMKKRLAEDPTLAKMKLVQVAYGQESEQINQQQTLALAQAFPDLKGIIVPAGIGLPAAARALDQAGLVGKIKLSGLAPVSMLKKYIVSGAVQDVWWNVKDLGYLTYYAAQAVAQCKVTGKPDETFDAGRLGKFTVGESGIVLLGDPVVATPDNVDKFDF